jgi:hypothetical protein
MKSFFQQSNPKMRLLFTFSLLLLSLLKLQAQLTITATPTSANALCAPVGPTVTFSGSTIPSRPGATWSWNMGDGSPLKSGQLVSHVFPQNCGTTNYTVTATATDTISLTGSLSFPVTIGPVPAPPIFVSESSITPNDGIVCAGTSVTLTASGGGAFNPTFNWGSGPGAAVLTVTPATTTTYTVSITDACGCVQTRSQTITVKPIPTAPVDQTVCRNNAPINLNSASWVPLGISFSGTGVSGNTFTPSSVPSETISVPITANFECPLSGTTDKLTDEFRVTLKNPPVANLRETVASCKMPGGTFDLQTMFDGGNSANGVFTQILGVPSLGISGTSITVPSGGGCFSINYVAPNPDGCPGTYTDTEELLITMQPSANFEITSPSSDLICQDGGTVPVSLVKLSSGPNPSLTINGSPAAFGTVNLAAPGSLGSLVYTICFTENGGTPGSCGSTLPGAGYVPCSSTICKTITIYNDGVGCGADAPFPSECPPNTDLYDPCPVSVNPSLDLECSFFELEGPGIVNAILEPQGITTCETETVGVVWESELPGELGNAASGGPKLKDFNAATEVLCDIITFEICLDIGVAEFCIDPIPLGEYEDYCDKTIGEVIIELLNKALKGDGGGGYVVADTDGDGSWDYVAEDFNGFPKSGTADIPNNVTTPQGTITIRNVAGWPFKPNSICGNIVGKQINLLDLLPIGAIPLVGVMIEDLLAAAQCNVNVVFSDAETIEIPVLNSSPPAFSSCPEQGYTFSENLSCDFDCNWSIPVAFDDCYGGGLEYKGRTATTDVSQYESTPPAAVAVTASGVYQTGGPISGSDLNVGDYTVTYTAYNCQGVSSVCSFPVRVTTGDPVLTCPNNMTVETDPSECSKVVTGLAPLEGIGCATIIDYNVNYPAGTLDVSTNTPYSIANQGTHNDVSGLTFPYGLTTVTYTMKVDINGDNDIADPGEVQNCSFNIVVQDSQKPVAVCKDLEVQLDNTGNITIFAANPGNNSPFVDGGSNDNCDPSPLLQIAKVGGPFSPSVNFGCTETGPNLVTLRVTDDDGNQQRCVSVVDVRDFFEGIQYAFDLPELCLEANNPSQFDFSNYLKITLPNAQVIMHQQVAGNAYLGDAVGGFGITAFAPSLGSTNDPGVITTDGVYTPGTGSGFVTVSYLMALPGVSVPQNGNLALAGCFEIVHTTFELRQPLVMGSPECLCVDELERIVDLGTVVGGLEPYRIQYSGVRLDVDADGDADDSDGIYTYDAANGHNINDFSQYLGHLRVIYTQPVWSFTIVDARGCEIFRSGSCDNDDLLIGPDIICPASNHTLTTEAYLCESQYTWLHPVPNDNCAVTFYDVRIKNPDGSIEGPMSLNAILYPPPFSYYNPYPNTNPPFPDSLNYQTYDFELGTSVITYYAEDALGNFTTCSFQITVSDDDPPHFLNCPEPPVVQNAESMHCDAYVNFALPIVSDNCDNNPTVVKIDQTGLNTGSRFPVGTTIMYWETKDKFDNRDTCQIKVIVNDYWQDPILTCPADVVKNNDPWLCGAVVNNIAPTVDGPCENNYGVTYTIYADAALTQVKDCGVTNAGGEFFDIGDSWVKYTVQNQPLLLITEVTQSGAVDRLEISNLGPADIDISCLLVNRLSVDPAANQTIGPVTMLPSLAGTILPVGGTQVFNFSFNGSANMPACYTISYMGTIFDEVSTNGFAGCNGFSGLLNNGDIIRKCEDDTDTAADWVLAQPCYPLTIGAINQDLEVMADNGTQTSLQSIEPNKVSCTFKVTVKDAENPFCGKLTSNTTYNGAGIPNINAATCNRSTITIPPSNCIIGDIVFNRTGTATPFNSTMTLISPKGIRVNITEVPDDSISTLFAQKAEGVWTLDIVPFPGQNPTITGWSLTVNCIAPFDLPNQVLPNQAGLCGASFTWTHPLFVDNCFNGTISVAYTTNNAACKPANGALLGRGGYTNTQFFCVGTTTVTYTLTDAAGNVSTCGFTVTVNDVERPLVTCPPTKFINLDGGACGAYVSYDPIFTSDNCAVTDTTMTPPSGSWFGIGTHLVTIVVTDAAGNTRSCTFNVVVIEYVPSDFNLICNDLSHVSMDATCVFVLNADEALEGDNYHCYDDYVITVKNQSNLPVDNIFDSGDIGKTFTVTVTDPETGNSCWSLLKIEDKLVPALTCPADITIACSESTSIAHTGNVNIQDCSATTTVIDDEYNDFGQCNDPRGEIVRTWIVTDAWANQAACSQTITITPFSLNDLVFPADYTVNCESAYLNAAATDPDNTGRPSINGFPIGVGGLCTASISFTDERFEICPGSYEILRTWKVRNTCFPVAPNNPISHVQVITVSDLGGPVFACPPTVTVSTNPFQCCSNTALPDMIVSEGCSHILDLEAKLTGVNPNNGNVITFTVGGSLADFPGNNYWNPDTMAVFGYTQCLPIGSYNVRYKATDECGNTSFCNFTLKVADLVPPAVACDQVTQVALTNDGMAIVPAANFDDGTTDNCCAPTFDVRRMNTNNCSGTAFGPDVKFCCDDIGDTILVVFRARDCYDNVNECMVSVLVEDKIKPICQSPANVTVNCENFDPSLWSYGIPDVADNCCLDNTKSYQSQVGLTHTVSYAQFDTVCNKGTITRTFRAFDCNGNSSQCTQRVIVTYLQDYFVKFPNDAIVTVCDGTGNFGEPTFFGEDCELMGVSHTDEVFTVVPDACFKIERTWQIINWCTFNPNLPLIEVPNPNPNSISSHPSNLPGPTVSACGTIVPWAPTVVKISPTDPTATNYCRYWGDDPAFGGNGNGTNDEANGYRYKQIIKVIDGQAPTATLVQPSCDNQNWFTPNNSQLWNEMYWWDNGIQTHDLCEEPTDLSITATDACSGANVNIEYLLFLDLDGDGTMETVVNSVNTGIAGLGWNNVLFNNLNTPNFGGGTSRAFDERSVPTNQKYGFSIQESVTGTNKTASVRWNTQQNQNTHVVPELPHGTHKIKWFVTDGCGNNSEYEYTFTVKDCKAPTVVCINGLSVNIMPTSMITLWASDFLQYTEDNCTPSGQIKIGIRKCGTGTGFPVDASGNPITNVTFTCNELGTQCVELWAIDAQGNADYCETYVIVQDNLGNCPVGNHINVAGALKTEMTEGVEEATVTVSGISTFTPPYSYFDLTDDNGNYQLVNNVPLDATFTIAPEKDDNPLNGVTTYDLVLISKHILGLEPLNSPYKMIAADANKSGSITTFDIVELRKLILGIYTELPNNTSWRFVDKAFVFPNPNNPFQAAFPETVSVANAMTTQFGKDFAGVKIGDVNSSAVANANMQAEERTDGTALFDVEDRDVKAGEEFEVTFKAAQQLKGFQFTMTLNGVNAIGVVNSDQVTDNNFNLLPQDAMAISIDGAQAFTVRFRAMKSGKLSEMLGVSGSITRAEAYGDNGRLNVALRFDRNIIAGVGFELYQNQPNPFLNKTSIGFFLPEAAEATLSVFDETGRTVYQQKGQFAKGMNTVMLERALINTTGMLYYKLETASDSATRKMIQAK